MSGWAWMWIGWFAMFFGIEGVALFNSKPGDTLNEHVWAWFGTQRRKPGEPERPRTGWTHTSSREAGSDALALAIRDLARRPAHRARTPQSDEDLHGHLLVSALGAHEGPRPPADFPPLGIYMVRDKEAPSLGAQAR